jgi:hypothetical protein
MGLYGLYIWELYGGYMGLYVAIWAIWCYVGLYGTIWEPIWAIWGYVGYSLWTLNGPLWLPSGRCMAHCTPPGLIITLITLVTLISLIGGQRGVLPPFKLGVRVCIVGWVKGEGVVCVFVVVCMRGVCDIVECPLVTCTTRKCGLR